MNILVIATHHGAFLTLNQIKLLGVKNVTVVIPQSQIDKYKGFEGEIFTEYERNLKRFCGKKIKLYADASWDMRSKLHSARRFLNGINASGQWMVLEAGSLLGIKHMRTLNIKTTFAVAKQRVHPKMKKLYKMLGQPEESNDMFLGCFFVNMENNTNSVSYLEDEIWHADILYAKSFGMLWCIRYRQMMHDCWCMNFWMEAIRGTQDTGEWVAYPYHLYMAYASGVEHLIPEQSAKNIEANGWKSDWLDELVALDL